MSDYRILFQIMKRRPGQDEFEVIADGSSGDTETLEEAASGATSFLQSLTNEQGEEATPDRAAGTCWDPRLAGGTTDFDLGAVAHMREHYLPSVLATAPPDQQMTVAELHSYLAQFIAENRPPPRLEVDTGDGGWRPLLRTDVSRRAPEEDSAVTLQFGTEGEAADERYARNRHVTVRPRIGA